MDIKNCIRKAKDDVSNRNIVMSVRINASEKKFMKDKDLSPSLIFHEALTELGYSGK